MIHCISLCNVLLWFVLILHWYHCLVEQITCFIHRTSVTVAWVRQHQKVTTVLTSPCPQPSVSILPSTHPIPSVSITLNTSPTLCQYYPQHIPYPQSLLSPALPEARDGRYCNATRLSIRSSICPSRLVFHCNSKTHWCIFSKLCRCVHQVMEVCCIVFDIGVMLFEF